MPSSVLSRIVTAIGFVLAVSALVVQAGDEQGKGASPTSAPTLYVVGYSHLDTQWRWSYPQVIREFLPNTLRDNFRLFDKYPDYVFNWTGANRYRLMKEYYPADFARLKQYVAAGRWYPNGSSLEEGDVNMPSEESIIRQVMYGNEFFQREFHQSPSDFMLPDCFGFPASLPTILAHCGIKGFSTQKLTWGSAVGIPFNVGNWEGTDGQSIVAALNPGSYTGTITTDLSHDTTWLKRIRQDGDKSGVYVDYSYYGSGDRGGAPEEHSVQQLERSVSGDGPVHVISARADQMFDDLTATQIARLPRYKGDLLLTFHSSGAATSHAEMKQWNRQNEILADETERAAVIADWLGGLPYDRQRITDAWWRFLPGQFHDLMAGTALPKAYEFAWNDQVLAINEFAGVLGDSLGAVARGLDTRALGRPVVVYNPLSISRQDIVEAKLDGFNPAPRAVQVFGPDGQEVPSQVETRSGDSITVLFLARVPSVGFAVFDVRPSQSPSGIATELTATQSEIQNRRYRVRLDESGDIASIFDKALNRELLSGPARLAFIHENPVQFPAWNMDWKDQQKPPYAFVDGPAKIRVVENGPARVAIQIERNAQGSRFVQTIRLAAGDAGESLELASHIDWKTPASALKAVFPLTASNPLATYNWEPGTIQRTTNDPKKYEVPSHEWFDLTDVGGAVGASVLNVDRYGSDKPDDHTLRLTLLYSPGVRGGFQDQATQDWGQHDFVYALAGHASAWQGQTQWQAARLNYPLIAMLPPSHAGPLGSVWSWVQVNNPQVKIEAIKKAEKGEELIVRLNELEQKSARNVRLRFAAPVLSAREVDGQERPIGTAAEVVDGALVVDMSAYRPRAFAVTLGTSPTMLNAPTSEPVTLPFNAAVAGIAGDFDGKRNAIPADMLPPTIACGGVTFQLAPADSKTDAVACQGQTLTLPPGSGRRFYFLAAADGDVEAAFSVGDQKTALKIQNWNGYIGQWDTRLWNGKVVELTYDWHNSLAGLVPGYIKRDRVAWYCDHTRLADGSNDPYAFCYLFRYALKLPDGIQNIRLPDNPRIKILAATVADNPNADTIPARDLYPGIDHRSNQPPAISPAGGQFSDARKITISPAFYSAFELHFTLDGTDPMPTSPKYDEPFFLTQSATVKAAAVDAQGHAGPSASAHFDIQDRTPPTVVSAVAQRGTFRIEFSEPLRKGDAEDISKYSATPEIAIASATLVDQGTTVILTPRQPLPEETVYHVSVQGVRDLAGNEIGKTTTPDISWARRVFQSEKVRTFDGKGDGILHAAELLRDLARGEPQLPTAAEAPWTINLFVFFDRQPEELTTLAGFGDDTDTSGTQRYLLKFHDGIHFWGSNVDVTTGVPYDVGKWQMITATFDGKMVRLFKNARWIKSAEIQLNDAKPEVRIAPPGPWTNGHRLAGKIQGFSIWDAQISQEKIRAILRDMPEQ